jgi:hypothetical protein
LLEVLAAILRFKAEIALEQAERDGASRRIAGPAGKDAIYGRNFP